jgi:DNA mismatch endonuclease (patch repair protein)
MSDVHTIEQRHKNMAAIKGKNTKPEMVVRHFLWHRGYRYRLNHPRLPGKPDIVLRRYRVCIFINGCFWHGHENCKYYVVPKTRTEFWTAKIARNKERDKAVQQQLAAMGWRSITIWECQLKPKVRENTLMSLDYTLAHAFLEDKKVKTYAVHDGEECSSMAAEPMSSVEYGRKISDESYCESE